MSLEIAAACRPASLPRRILQRVARFMYDERPGDPPGFYAGIGLALDLRGSATPPKIQLTNQFMRLRRSIHESADSSLGLLALARSGERRRVISSYHRLLCFSQENAPRSEHGLNQARTALALFIAGRLWMGLQLMDQVVEPLRVALRDKTFKYYPEHADPIKVARLMVEMGRTEEALELSAEFLSFSEQSPSSNYYSDLGKIALFWAEQGKSAEALELVNRITTPYHHVREVYQANGYVLKKLGRDRELEETLQSARRGLPPWEESENSRDILSGEAQALADMGQLDEAKEIIRRSREARGLCRVASRLAQAKRFDEAIELAHDFDIFGDGPEFELAALGNIAGAMLSADHRIASPRRALALRDEAHQLLLQAVEAEDNIYRRAQELAVIDPTYANTVIYELIRNDDSLADIFKQIATDYKLAWVLSEIKIIERKRKLIEKPREYLEEIARTIVDKLAKALKLKRIPFTSATSGSSGAYGTISGGMSLAMRMDIRLGMDLLPGGGLTIEAGTSIEDARERIQTLNFLVHHEVAHQVQKERRIAEPTIAEHWSLDQHIARRQANEVLVDKLALEAARGIYVHVEEGFKPITSKEREAVAIEAYSALLRIIERNHLTGAQVLLEETQARLIAVMLELGLDQPAQAFKERLFRGQKPVKIEDLDRLILEYRGVFRPDYLGLI